jgi:hypothetical protein
VEDHARDRRRRDQEIVAAPAIRVPEHLAPRAGARAVPRRVAREARGDDERDERWDRIGAVVTVLGTAPDRGLGTTHRVEVLRLEHRDEGVAERQVEHRERARCTADAVVARRGELARHRVPSLVRRLGRVDPRDVRAILRPLGARRVTQPLDLVVCLRPLLAGQRRNALRTPCAAAIAAASGDAPRGAVMVPR